MSDSYVNTSALAFVDTNILLYAYDHSEAVKQAKAEALLSELWQRRTGCLSIQVLQEFYVNATRKLSVPLDVPTARQVIADYACWIVHVPTSADVLGAIDLQQANKLSYWDAMILQSALTLGCKSLWSEDLNPGQWFADLELRTPF